MLFGRAQVPARIHRPELGVGGDLLVEPVHQAAENWLAAHLLIQACWLARHPPSLVVSADCLSYGPAGSELGLPASAGVSVVLVPAVPVPVPVPVPAVPVPAVAAPAGAEPAPSG
jgi:hypothetical protein